MSQIFTFDDRLFRLSPSRQTAVRAVPHREQLNNVEDCGDEEKSGHVVYFRQERSHRDGKRASRPKETKRPSSKANCFSTNGAMLTTGSKYGTESARSRRSPPTGFIRPCQPKLVDHPPAPWLAARGQARRLSNHRSQGRKPSDPLGSPRHELHGPLADDCGGGPAPACRPCAYRRGGGRIPTRWTFRPRRLAGGKPLLERAKPVVAQVDIILTFSYLAGELCHTRCQERADSGCWPNGRNGREADLLAPLRFVTSTPRNVSGASGKDLDDLGDLTKILSYDQDVT